MSQNSHKKVEIEIIRLI